MDYLANREERVARAIAASKRGVSRFDPSIDKVWTSYLGQARAAIAAVNESIAYTATFPLGYAGMAPKWQGYAGLPPERSPTTLTSP